VRFLQKFFVRLTLLPLQGFEVTHPIFDDVQTRLPDAFHHLVPNDNFHCQTPLKTPNLAVKNAIWQIWLRMANCDSPTGYGMRFSVVLSNYNGMTVYICRQFIPTTVFLVSAVTVCC